jgi:hypothetical protein
MISAIVMRRNMSIIGMISATSSKIRGASGIERQVYHDDF